MSPNVNLRNKAGDLSQPESLETNLMPDEPPQSASSDWDVSGPAETNHMEVMERFNDTENETSPDFDIIELPINIGESDILIADVNKNVPFVSEGEICEENEFPHMVSCKQAYVITFQFSMYMLVIPRSLVLPDCIDETAGKHMVSELNGN